MCYQTHNGIAELGESVAELRRGHEGEKICLPKFQGVELK